MTIRVEYNSLGCENSWGHDDIFKVEDLTKLFPEETGSLGLIPCLRFDLKTQTANSLWKTVTSMCSSIQNLPISAEVKN
jgi:hypothetical protein